MSHTERNDYVTSLAGARPKNSLCDCQSDRDSEPVEQTRIVAWLYRYGPDLQWHATIYEDELPTRSDYPSLEVQPLTVWDVTHNRSLPAPSVSDQSREAGETEGLDPTDAGEVLAEQTPDQSPVQKEGIAYKTCVECNGTGVGGRVMHGFEEELIRCEECDGVGSVPDLPLPVQKEGMVENLIERLTPYEAWHILVNMDDRTSPEEYPDHALITLDELKRFMEAAQAQALTTLTETKKERDGWKRGYLMDGVCEIGAANPNVASYMDHWEGRALKAEARAEALQAENGKLKGLQEVLELFIPIYEPWMDRCPDHGKLFTYRTGRTIGDLRRARALLNTKGESDA